LQISSKGRKGDKKRKLKERMCKKCYYQLQFVEESRQCKNPNNECSPKRKIILGKRKSQKPS